MRQMQSHGISLKPTTVLRELSRHRPRNLLTLLPNTADATRRIFDFSIFNAVQSKVFDSVGQDRIFHESTLKE